MGADGGSIPDRRDLVRTRGKAEKADPAVQRERFLFCALSKKPLAKPVVADPLGKLYNKDAVLEYLIDHSAYADGEQICPYIKGVKDLLTLDLMPNPALEKDSTSMRAPFVCWLSLKEMTGAVPFVAIRNCGCVFSDTSLRGIIPNLSKPLGENGERKEEGPKEAACPNCGKAFDPTSPTALLPIYPSDETQALLLEALLALRAAQKANKKRKAEKVDKEKKDKEPVAKVARTGSVSGSASPAVRVPKVAPSTVVRSVQEKLLEQEQKRLAAKAGMSDAVKSLFTKDDGKPKSGVDDFFGRTFNRYA